MTSKAVIDKIIKLREKGFSFAEIADTLSTNDTRYSKQAVYGIYKRYLSREEHRKDIEYLGGGIFIRVGSIKETLDILKGINKSIKTSEIKDIISDVKFIRDVRDASIEVVKYHIACGASYEELKEYTKLNDVAFKDDLLMEIISDIFYLKSIGNIVNNVKKFKEYTNNEDKAKELYNKFGLNKSYTLMFNRVVRNEGDSLIVNQ